MPATETQSPVPPGDDFAARLRGFGPLGILAAVLVLLAGNVFLNGFILPLGALLVVLWLHLSRTPWHEIGYAQPRSWLYTVAAGLALGVALKFAMKAVVMPLFGADPINRAYGHLAGNPDLILATLWTVLVVGLAEETVFRGFLFERLRKILGDSAIARAAIVLMTSALFGAAHLADQGVPGMQNAAVTGLVLGSIFAVTRNLWLPIIAHSAFDLTAYGLIYWGLESQVAHLFFT